MLSIEEVEDMNRMAADGTVPKLAWAKSSSSRIFKPVLFYNVSISLGYDNNPDKWLLSIDVEMVIMNYFFENRKWPAIMPSDYLSASKYKDKPPITDIGLKTKEAGMIAIDKMLEDGRLVILDEFDEVINKN
jgi:hypothetical protein